MRAKRYDGSGQWLLQHERFLQWVNNSNRDTSRILCCYGMPGAGKTILRYLTQVETIQIQVPLANILPVRL